MTFNKRTVETSETLGQYWGIKMIPINRAECEAWVWHSYLLSSITPPWKKLWLIFRKKLTKLTKVFNVQMDFVVNTETTIEMTKMSEREWLEKQVNNLVDFRSQELFYGQELRPRSWPCSRLARTAVISILWTIHVPTVFGIEVAQKTLH